MAIGAKLVADMLSVAGITRVITMDLHADQEQGFFDVPVDHLYASSVMLPYIQSLKLPNLVIATPDVGGSKRASAYSKFLGCPLVLCNKTRRRPNEVATMQIIGDVKDADVVLIDTAGRLHNKVGLMNELKKIKDVMKKVLPEAPDEVLLVLDGSTGQNAFEQAKQFAAVTQITSLAITKLDGTAKGGVVIGISDQLKVPVKYIGLGEGMEDLQLFDRKEFVDSLFA